MNSKKFFNSPGKLQKQWLVNQYILESISPDGKTIIFVTESIENIPKGYRCRDTYRLNDAHEMSEAFDMAEPGKEFEPYTKASFKKLK